MVDETIGLIIQYVECLIAVLAENNTSTTGLHNAHAQITRGLYIVIVRLSPSSIVSCIRQKVPAVYVTCFGL